MENLYYEEQEREEKRRKKLERRGKGAKALSKSAAAWTLLTQGNITENLDLASDASDDDLEDDYLERIEDTVTESMEKLEVTENTTQNAEEDETIAVNDTTLGFVRKVTTALSKEALRRASQFILNLEIFVAILHSGLMCAGYKNVFLSDIVRWVREDRFRISRRAIRLFRQSAPERTKRGEKYTTSMSYGEPFLRLPLFEIMRTCTLFNQSVTIQKNMIPQKFETLAARLIDNLNLPVDFLSRVLLLESIVPCDVSPLLWRQVDVKMGQTLEDISMVEPQDYYNSFMTCFGRKERFDLESDSCDEVLLSVDTKLVAYVLLAFRLTFDLDNAPCSAENLTYQTFDIDTWIHQLEMRMKCWEGHDMSMVLRSTCPVPEINIDTPFGANFFYTDNRGGPRVQRRRRQIGFHKCIPQEMSFNSTASLPTVFDVRRNRFAADRKQAEAVMSPLKFQRVVLRKEMDSNPKLFENIDEQSEKTFFREFTTSKTTESSNTFNDYFPSSSSYAIYKRPDWLQNCAARKSTTAPKTGPFRFYLSNKVCDDLIGVAESSFSRRFKFLLKSLSLLIGEHEKAVYAAFVMLEMHLTSSERLNSIREDLLISAPISMECQKFKNSMYHEPCRYHVMADHPTDRIEDLGCFIVFRASREEEEIATSHHLYLVDSRNHEIRETLTEAEAEQIKKRILKLCYNFETFFGILAVKFW
uniref:Uncharacterized protein n=1 Tax=Caenorhabditis tropicalis TaxID=1561998 RepID=A0A1I7UJW6_9PELO